MTQIQEMITNDVEQVKDVITNALFGNTNAEESIEILSELLFPGENLLQQIQNQKVIQDMSKRLASLNEKGLEIQSIDRQSEGFVLIANFQDVNTFLTVQSKVMTIIKHIAAHYHTTVIPNFVITEIIRGQ